MRTPFAIALAALSLVSCQTTNAGRRYSKNEAAAALSRLERVSLEVGEFEIDGANSVVDGDTIRVKGLDNSLRLLAIDTEETFKHDKERKLFAAGWASYLVAMRGNSTRPVKMATPLGEDAKEFARGFFEGVTRVRLERDHPGEIRDYYNRYLAYIFVEKNGKWVNYNLETVRAGMSPYFTKYGRSRRFHSEFVDAEAQARQAKLGIWNPSLQHYDDYPERLAWWNKRAETLARFERQMAESPKDHFVLTRWDSLLRLEQHLGETVVLMGAVSDVKLGDRGPSVVKLSRNRGNDFDVVFWDKDVLLSSGILQNRGEFVQVRGVVSRYVDQQRHTQKLQMMVSLPGQVIAPSPELEKLLEASEGAERATTTDDGE